jgi:hypothetical protein
LALLIWPLMSSLPAFAIAWATAAVVDKLRNKGRLAQ